MSTMRKINLAQSRKKKEIITLATQQMMKMQHVRREIIKKWPEQKILPK